MTPLTDHYLTQLRDIKTPRAYFRQAADRLNTLLAQEAAKRLQTHDIAITTPVRATTGSQISEPVTLIAILRSGLAMLTVFQQYFADAPVGFIGMQRDEATAVASEYYRKLPPIPADHRVLLLDPMLATAGTATAAVRMLEEAGVTQKQIMFVGVIAAPEGVEVLKKECPNVDVIVAAVDDSLNDSKFIVPGLGDFGDRYYGTD